MGITVQWDNDEKTIVLVTFDAVWTWDDLRAVDEYAIPLYDSSEHIVDVIADLRHSHLVMTGILSYMRELLTMQWHPRAGNVVVVGASLSVRTLMEAAALVTRRPLARISFAQTIDEARLTLRNRRAKR
ncbi:MAG: hypothetical protein U0694_10360 [Anaerolineae bacterium]